MIWDYIGLGINDKGKGGNTPLHLAAQRNHEEIVIWLIEHGGADHGAKNDEGKTPYDMTEHFGIRKYLLTLRFPKKASVDGGKIGLGGVPLRSPKV